MTLRTEIDARYAGQAFEVTVPFGSRWQHAFHDRHAAHYGFADPGWDVEAVRLRVRGEGTDAPTPRRARLREPARYRTRTVRARQALPRAALAKGTRVRGPVRLDEDSATSWVPAGWAAEVPREGVLRLRRSP